MFPPSRPDLSGLSIRLFLPLIAVGGEERDEEKARKVIIVVVEEEGETPRRYHRGQRGDSGEEDGSVRDGSVVCAAV